MNKQYTTKKYRVSDVVKAASKVSGIPAHKMTARNRTGFLIEVRRAIIIISHQNGHTWRNIARVLERNHSTVIQAYKKIGNEKMIRDIYQQLG